MSTDVATLVAEALAGYRGGSPSLAFGAARELPPDPVRSELRRAAFAAHPERRARAADASVDDAVALLGGGDFEAATAGADDVFVVRRDATITGHAIAFPSGYAPELLLGRSLADVHAPVPGMDALQAPVARFVARLPVGAARNRVLLGLSGSGELDRHPSALAPIPASLESCDLRFELQRFVGTPAGVVMLIRVLLVPWSTLQADLRVQVCTTLGELSQGLRNYKGIPIF